MFARTLVLAAALVAAANLAPAQASVPAPPYIEWVVVADWRIFTPSTPEEPLKVYMPPFECTLGIVQNSGSSLVGTIEIFNENTNRTVTIPLTGRMSVYGDAPVRVTLSGSGGTSGNRTSFYMTGSGNRNGIYGTGRIRMGTDSASGEGVIENLMYRPLHVMDLNWSSSNWGVVRGTCLSYVPYSLMPFASNFVTSLNRYTGLWQFSASSSASSMSFSAVPDVPTPDDLSTLGIDPGIFQITRARANVGYGTMNVHPEDITLSSDEEEPKP